MSEAKKALSELSGLELEGRELRVDVAENRGQSGGGGGWGGGRGGRGRGRGGTPRGEFLIACAPVILWLLRCV